MEGRKSAVNRSCFVRLVADNELQASDLSSEGVSPAYETQFIPRKGSYKFVRFCCSYGTILVETSVKAFILFQDASGHFGSIKFSKRVGSLTRKSNADVVAFRGRNFPKWQKRNVLRIHGMNDATSGKESEQSKSCKHLDLLLNPNMSLPSCGAPRQSSKVG